MKRKASSLDHSCSKKANTGAPIIRFTVCQDPAKELFDQGVVVIRSQYFMDNLSELQQRFEDEVRKFPEFSKHPALADLKKEIKQGNVDRYCVGGTSFLGNPAVFHNPLSRELRQTVCFELKDLFLNYKHKYLQDDTYKLEICVDRILCRPPGDVPTKESWHRDEAPSADPLADKVFGGWLNLDSDPQYFSCVPGSHNFGRTDDGQGFHKIAADECKIFETKKQIMEVPPGHIIVFLEDIAHEIISNASTMRPYTTIRQFNGFRFTKSDQPLHGEDYIRECLKTQSVMKIKSNQMPALYPRISLMYSQHRAKKNIFVKEMTIGEEYIDPKTRNFVSLQEISERTQRNVMYDPYTEEEIDLLLPRHEHVLRNPSTGEKVKISF